MIDLILSFDHDRNKYVAELRNDNVEVGFIAECAFDTLTDACGAIDLLDRAFRQCGFDLRVSAYRISKKNNAHDGANKINRKYFSTGEKL